MNQFMQAAIEEARKGIYNNDGGPFGAVIVKDNVIVGKGHNEVVKRNDPTLHGEIMAIKDACKNLNTFDLKGCVIYTTAEPCPMCLGAILWANIDKVYYGSSVEDTKKIGFKDQEFYQVLINKDMLLKNVNKDECLILFNEYQNLANKTMY